MQTRARHKHTETTDLDDNTFNPLNVQDVLKNAGPPQTITRRTMKKDTRKQASKVSAIKLHARMQPDYLPQENDIKNGNYVLQNPHNPQIPENSVQCTPTRALRTSPPPFGLTGLRPPAHAGQNQVAQTVPDTNQIPEQVTFAVSPEKGASRAQSTPPQVPAQATSPPADIATTLPASAAPLSSHLLSSSYPTNNSLNSIVPPLPVPVGNLVGTMRELPYPPALHNAHDYHLPPAARSPFAKSKPFTPVAGRHDPAGHLAQASGVLPLPPFTPRTGLSGPPNDLTPTKAAHRIFVSTFQV